MEDVLETTSEVIASDIETAINFSGCIPNTIYVKIHPIIVIMAAFMYLIEHF